MWFALMGLPGAVQTIDDNVDTLLTRLSATKSGYLDAAISSRASASTWNATRAGYLDTLHNTRLTAGRASNLDNLDAAISSVGKPVPTALAGNHTAYRLDQIPCGQAASSVSAGTNTNQWYTIWSLSDSGYISFASVYCTSTLAENWDTRILINGAQVAIQTGLSGTLSAHYGSVFIGHAETDYSTADVTAFSTGPEIRFTSAVSLQVRRTSGSGSRNWSAKAYYWLD